MTALLPAALWPGTWPMQARLPLLKEMEFNSVLMNTPLWLARLPFVGFGTAAWLVAQGWRETDLPGLGQILQITHHCSEQWSLSRRGKPKTQNLGLNPDPSDSSANLLPLRSLGEKLPGKQNKTKTYAHQVYAVAEQHIVVFCITLSPKAQILFVCLLGTGPCQVTQAGLSS